MLISKVERRVFYSHSYPRFFFRQAFDIFGDLLKVAEINDGNIVGYVLGALKPNALEAWVLSLAVDKKYRRQKIGWRLTSDLLSIFQDRKIKRVLLTVEPDNCNAINLYKKFGFVEVSRDNNYFGFDEARVVMQKKG
ncbi:MAG: N-acetyltransferase [Syntrophales bacterium]|jgi:ribosomal protein S18 acetylase RimI-like enzyme